MAENANTKAICVKLIKSKLEAKALETLSEDANTYEVIVDALKDNIKPDSSMVIEGRMLSLHLDKNNVAKFVKQAEELAEALRRSLIVEGISKPKADEMSIAKRVELCRKTARSGVVKSVISASKFSKPAEVLAKFTTESETAKRERQETSNFNKNKNNNVVIPLQAL